MNMQVFASDLWNVHTEKHTLCFYLSSSSSPASSCTAVFLFVCVDVAVAPWDKGLDQSLHNAFSESVQTWIEAVIWLQWVSEWMRGGVHLLGQWSVLFFSSLPLDCGFYFSWYARVTGHVRPQGMVELPLSGTLTKSVCLCLFSPFTRVGVATFQMLRTSRCESLTGADSLPAAAARCGLINKYTSYVNGLIGIGLPELSFSFSGTEACVFVALNGRKCWWG